MGDFFSMDESLQFEGLSSDVHQCTSHRDGEWITWRCPHCKDYERRLNWKTGEMKVNRADSPAKHVGLSTREQNMEGLSRVMNHN
ncbi:MAG: hypothetical protein DYG98_00250 [Haliscomenobacteraceae bacterium CHB4]|nr:hypothetical protein [Haliscomenobacteraceae bacterium CHB4]